MRKSTLLFIVAIIFLILVIADSILWLSVNSETFDISDTNILYLKYYPEFLQDFTLLNIIAIILLVFAGLAFVRTRRRKTFRSYAIPLGIICGILLVYRLFVLLLLE